MNLSFAEHNIPTHYVPYTKFCIYHKSMRSSKSSRQLYQCYSFDHKPVNITMWVMPILSTSSLTIYYYTTTNIWIHLLFNSNFMQVVLHNFLWIHTNILIGIYYELQVQGLLFLIITKNRSVSVRQHGLFTITIILGIYNYSQLYIHYINKNK